MSSSSSLSSSSGMYFRSPQALIEDGRGTFHMNDLSKEINGIYEKHKKRIFERLRRRNEQLTNEDSFEVYYQESKKEAFDIHVYYGIDFLISIGALFIGMKVNCQHCGSNLWYPLGELNSKISCKGCFSTIMPSLKSKVYYRLNEIIMNNLIADPTRGNVYFDGNYVVLRALINLRRGNDLNNAFIWAPCLDFKGINEDSVITSDADILVIQNGELVVGEAKHNATEFTLKVKNSLVWMANELWVDKIMIACAEGDLAEAAQYISDRLTNRDCKVEIYKVAPTQYSFSAIHGEVPTAKKEDKAKKVQN